VPADTNGDNVYELTAALSVHENQGAGREGVRPTAFRGRARRRASSPAPRDLGGEFTHIGCVQRPGIAEIDAESGAVSGWTPLRDGFTVSLR
jgi:hypothetical protein